LAQAKAVHGSAGGCRTHVADHDQAEEGKDVYVFGSAELLDSLLKAGLVDEYRICVAPVVLGGGNPLFKPQDQQVKMRLESARPLKTGGAILTYAVGG
jgi:dihydrofolate reductase